LPVLQELKMVINMIAAESDFFIMFIICSVYINVM